MKGKFGEEKKEAERSTSMEKYIFDVGKTGIGRSKGDGETGRASEKERERTREREGEKHLA